LDIGWVQSFAWLGNEGFASRGQIESGLTFPGLRHTAGTVLDEATDDLDPATARPENVGHGGALFIDGGRLSKMRAGLDWLDPLGAKSGTKVSNAEKTPVKRVR
jgi:hypothetical protein